MAMGLPFGPASRIIPGVRGGSADPPEQGHHSLRVTASAPHAIEHARKLDLSSSPSRHHGTALSASPPKLVALETDTNIAAMLAASPTGSQDRIAPERGRAVSPGVGHKLTAEHGWTLSRLGSLNEASLVLHSVRDVLGMHTASSTEQGPVGEFDEDQGSDEVLRVGDHFIEHCDRWLASHRSVEVQGAQLLLKEVLVQVRDALAEDGSLALSGTERMELSHKVDQLQQQLDNDRQG